MPKVTSKTNDDSPPPKRRRGLLTLVGLILIGAVSVLTYRSINQRNADETQVRAQVLSDSEESERLNSMTRYFDDHPLEEAKHPLDPVVEVARLALKQFREHVTDYTATLDKQERIGSKLYPNEKIFCKVRQQSKNNSQPVKPFAVYLNFQEPKSMKGREVIWVKGENNDRLLAHESGWKSLFTAKLKTDSFLAMRGNRYPISEFGIETLITRLIEKGEHDRKLGPCLVRVQRNLSIDDRPCTQIEIEHSKRDERFDFHLARVIIDDELNIPIHYASYFWPAKQGGDPELIEQYTYSNVLINEDLTDADFDSQNDEYRFP